MRKLIILTLIVGCLLPSAAVCGEERRVHGRFHADGLGHLGTFTHIEMKEPEARRNRKILLLEDVAAYFAISKRVKGTFID